MRSSRADAQAEIEAVLEKHLPDLEPATRRVLLGRIAQAIQAAVDRERRLCVETCRERAVLWRKTSAAESSVDRAREEAQARANEAQYLADWLETRAEPPEVSEVSRDVS